MDGVVFGGIGIFAAVVGGLGFFCISSRRRVAELEGRLAHLEEEIARNSLKWENRYTEIHHICEMQGQALVRMENTLKSMIASIEESPLNETEEGKKTKKILNKLLGSLAPYKGMIAGAANAAAVAYFGTDVAGIGAAGVVEAMIPDEKK
jgi:hypothetical protein